MKRIGEDDAFRASGTSPLLAENQHVDAGGSIQADESHECNEARAPETVPVQIIEAEPQENRLECRDARSRLRVGLAEDGAVCHDGVVRIPLELTLGSETRRLVVSIAIDQP